MGSVCLLTALTACVHSGTPNSVKLAAVPSDIRVCFNRLVPAPARGEMKQSDMLRLVADLKRSELKKSECGKRLLAFYDTQQKMFK
jgi:hypothetical protein